jgi:hypothetical protein
MIGQVVVLRDNAAGVFVGTLAEFDQAAKTCRLTDARKIHYWVGAGAVEGLATHGCKDGSRITAKVAQVATCDVVQIVSTTPVGAKCLMDWPEWPQ